MNLAFDQERFRRELPGWTGRLVLCALPSAGLEAIEFHAPFELAAMAAGVAIYVSAAAWFCSCELMRATARRERFVRSLKMAAWIKAGLLFLAVGGWGLAAGLNFDAGACLAVGLLPDLLAGLGSVWLVSLLAGAPNLAWESLHGFGWTLAATLVQGAMISAYLGLIAWGVFAVTRTYSAHRDSSPARLWG